MASSCGEARNALLECLADSPCVSGGRSIKECMDDEKECYSARVAYFQCKRGQLDMRKRIKGNLLKGGDESEQKAAE